MECPYVSGMETGMDVKGKMKDMQKILYLFDQEDWKSRLPVATKAKDSGMDITIGLIGTGAAQDPILANFGNAHVPKPKGGLSPLAMLTMIKHIRTLIRTRTPDLIHTVTVKYAFIVGLGALPFPHTKKIFTMAGLGYLFRGGDKKSAILRAIISPLLKYVLKRPGTILIFQNPDDLELMIKGNYVTRDNAVLVKGSGVDLAKFTPTSNDNDENPLVLMPTRLVVEKGVHIFIDAARMLKKRGIKARFQIAGGETVHNPKAISKEQMEALVADGSVEWLGRVEDMPGLLAAADLIVYPSYYGEGVPRVMLESLAAGRAIITTDNPGCKETIRKGENGILIPVRDVEATANAMEKLIKDQPLRKKMGKQSRKLAEEEFDINIIAQKTLDVYKTALKAV